MYINGCGALCVSQQRAQDTKFQKDKSIFLFSFRTVRTLMFPSFFIKLIFMLFALASSNQPIDMYICIWRIATQRNSTVYQSKMQKRGRQRIPIFFSLLFFAFVLCLLCPDTLASQLFFIFFFFFLRFVSLFWFLIQRICWKTNEMIFIFIQTVCTSRNVDADVFAKECRRKSFFSSSESQ